MAAAKAPAKGAKPRKAAGRAKPAPKATASRPPARKADGDAPVRACIDSLPAWQRDLARRFDAVAEREVPGVRRAVKWGAAFYGVPGQGWFASVKGFTRHLKVTFFRGTSLRPVPPSGEHPEGRSLDLREGDALDEEAMAAWVRQAAAIPGWGA